jgi:hypothetical protein
MSAHILTWKERVELSGYGPDWATRSRDAEIADLRAALQAQQGDALEAARYRWLRDSPDSGRCIRAIYEDGASHPKEVDALVDAAMLAARREG